MYLFNRRGQVPKGYVRIGASQPFPCIAHLQMGGLRKVVMNVENYISLKTIRQKEILRFAASEIQEVWIGSETSEFQSSVCPNTCMTIATGSWRVALEFPTFKDRVLFIDSIRALLKHNHITITQV